MTRRKWELVVAPSADRTLARLPEKAATAIVEFLVGPLLESPKRVGHRLQRELAGLWSTRRGAYRVVYELDEDARQVRVLRIEHRADVYRPAVSLDEPGLLDIRRGEALMQIGMHHLKQTLRLRHTL